jgi:hypothetical protein
LPNLYKSEKKRKYPPIDTNGSYDTLLKLILTAIRYFLPICFSANVLVVISKTFVKTKEFNNGKFSKMFGCVFGGFVGEIPANVKHGKLGKPGGGGYLE